METARPISVVILYTHPLLGEGIAKLLGGEPGLQITHIPTGEVEAAEAALAGDPDVVIFERNQPLQAIDLLRLAPDALLIDVGVDAGPTFTYHREKIPTKPEGIVDAIRELRHVGRGAVVGAFALIAAASMTAGSIGGG